MTGAGEKELDATLCMSDMASRKRGRVARAVFKQVFLKHRL